MQRNSVNKTLTVGRMGQDVELKYTPANLAVANISVATTDARKGADGNIVETTEWNRIVLFGKTAEFAEKYLGKGHLVSIEGRLQTRSWENKEGVKVYTTEIICNELTPLAKPGQGAGSGTAPAKSAPAAGGAPTGTTGEDDEPLPF